MAQLKDTIVTGNISVSGTVNGRDIAADGAKLDTLYQNKFRYQFDVAKNVINQTVIAQNTYPRFRLIKSMLSAVISVDYSYIPVSIILKWYDKDGTLHSENFGVSNSIGVSGYADNNNGYADLTQGAITIETAIAEDVSKTHVYELMVEII